MKSLNFTTALSFSASSWPLVVSMGVDTGAEVPVVETVVVVDVVVKQVVHDVVDIGESEEDVKITDVIELVMVVEDCEAPEGT